jgi:hypothetical protein
LSDEQEEDWPRAHPPGAILLRITNADTGHVEIRMLESDEYAILYGPGWRKVEEYRVPITGDVLIRLRPVR